MKRRDVLKGMGAIALYSSFPGVLAEFVSSCKSKAQTLRAGFFADDEFALIEEITDIILPKTSTPGGLETQVPYFLDLVVKNCLAPADQQSIQKGLKQLNADGKFSSLSKKEKITLVDKTDAAAFNNDADKAWFMALKRLALIGHLPAAYATGNLTLRPFSTVESVIWDSKKNKATGVRIIDTETMKTYEYFAPVIFLNASALATTKILLQSTSDRFPEGFANDSGVVGHYLMDHYSGPGAAAQFDILKDQYYFGQRSTSVYVPRFQNLQKKDRPFNRGYAYEVYVSRAEWTRGYHAPGTGEEWKDSLSAPGPWQASMFAFGECLPNYKNRVYLDKEKKDKWGLPVLNVEMEYGDNEKSMRAPMISDAMEMLQSGGPVGVSEITDASVPGMTIHEMGTARMGSDPKTSVLNRFNQCHSAPNVFITDGACMDSTACQNPSLTYMALTARACDYAVNELKKGNIK